MKRGPRVTEQLGKRMFTNGNLAKRILLFLPLFLCIACYEQDMTVAIEERLPPTFKLNGSGNLVFFSVSEVGSDNQRRIPIDRDDDNDRELWQIWPSGLSQEARVIRRLPPITYGVVPEGWVQKYQPTVSLLNLLKERSMKRGGPPLTRTEALVGSRCRMEGC